MMDPRAIADIFAPFGPVRLKRMFSGHGVFVDELCIALELSGEIFLKADGETEESFAAAGSRPFSYQRAGKITKVGFWRLPDDAFENEEELRRWCDLALGAARRAALRKPKSRRKPKAGREARPARAASGVRRPRAAPMAGRARPKPP